MDSKEDLLNAFLRPTAESCNEKDELRFVKYAVACVEEKVYIDTDKMQESGFLSEEKIHKYELAFTWIRLTYEYASNKVADELIEFHREHEQKLSYTPK